MKLPVVSVLLATGLFAMSSVLMSTAGPGPEPGMGTDGAVDWKDNCFVVYNPS